jgi:predicted pyridoxine 5'-phosphate oxidase superfamily flavin-nucleotide-binding protein
MAKQFPKLENNHADFIRRQNIFFTASAAATGRVNVSPRSTDALRLLSDNAVIYLDRTGSGNETAAHLRANGRMTIMFCAVEGPPLIMRLYGQGRVIRRDSTEYAELLASHFAKKEPLGARQMVRLDFDLVQTSCGYGVPLFQHQGERDSMDNWAQAKGVNGIKAYWREKNAKSIDGFQTGMFEDETNQE